MKNSYRWTAVVLTLVLMTTAMLSGTLAKYTSEFSGQDTALVARWKVSAENGFVDGANATSKTLELFKHKYETYMTQKVKDGDNDYYIIAPGVDGTFDINFSYTGDVDAAFDLQLAKSGDGAGVPLKFSLNETFDDNTITYDLNELAEMIMDNAKYEVATSNASLSYPKSVIFDPSAIPPGPISQITKLEESVYENNRSSDVIMPNRTSFVKGLQGAPSTPPAYPIVVTRTAADKTTYVKATVYWKWEYDVSEHDPIKLEEAGFKKDWTDADDTKLGIDSATGATTALGNRLDYTVTATLTATQVMPQK